MATGSCTLMDTTTDKTMAIASNCLWPRVLVCLWLRLLIRLWLLLVGAYGYVFLCLGSRYDYSNE